jgi:hypothetical protein
VYTETPVLAVLEVVATRDIETPSFVPPRDAKLDMYA